MVLCLHWPSLGWTSPYFTLVLGCWASLLMSMLSQWKLDHIEFVHHLSAFTSPMVDLMTVFCLLFPFFSESNSTSQVFPQTCLLISHPPLLPFCEALDKAFFFLGSFLRKPGIGLLCSGIPTHWLRHGSLTPGRWGVGGVQNPIWSWFPLPFPPSLEPRKGF